MNRKTKNKPMKKGFYKKYRKLIIIFLYLIILSFVFKYAENFVIDKYDLKILINGEDPDLEYAVYIENRTLYMSTDDVDKLFDSKTYIEENDEGKIEIISITDTKILRITEDENTIEINNTEQNISNSIIKKGKIYYLPISEITGIYNLELTEYENNIFNFENLNTKKEISTLKNKAKLKYKATNISKSVETLRIGQTVTILEQGKKWTKVQTGNGNIGYVKTKKLNSIETDREEFDIENILDENEFDDIKVLKDNDLEDDIDNITINYNSRKEFIIKILNVAIKNKVDAIEINLNNIENTENYYRFLEELKPYLNEYYISLIVVKTENLDENRLKEVSNEVI